MMFTENVRIGIHSIKKARFRSFFTMLGIIIGVVSVVTIVSLGEGVKRQITGQVSDLGANIVTIRPGKLVNRDDSGKITSVNLLASSGVASLTPGDLETVRKIDGVKAAASMGTISGTPSVNKKTFNDAVIIVSSQNLTSVIDHKVEFGTFFDAGMYQRRDAVIGPNVAAQLFGETVPIGKSFKLRDETFTVQGIFEPFKEVPLASTINLNNAIFIPEPAAEKLVGADVPAYEILVKANGADKVEPVATGIEKILKANHGGQEDFTVFKQDEISATSDQLLDLLTRMIMGMAGVTLLVSGIGIMNVMFVSVSERTKEIGIRKAIGATNRQIRSQFMIEAIILSVWGVILGVMASALMNIILRLTTDLQPVLVWQPIAIASGLSIAVGIIFGVIPAVKASKKDPIHSLRPN